MHQRLVVGIDYGTSNSGAAYALLGEDDDDSSKNNVDIEVLKDWPNPGTGRDCSEKVPSDISYDASGRPSGYGFEVAKDKECLQWVKLLLEPDAIPQVSTHPSSVLKVWKAYELLGNKLPVQAVADYLTWLWATIKEYIVQKEDIDDSEAEVLFQPPNLKVVLTVPASWSERAKNHIQEAAVKAGIPERSIRLLSEPEAAAIFGLKRQAKKGALAIDDYVIVCDGGGGTVDVVIYKVRSLTPFLLDQVTVSKGSFCGSVFIDLEFQNQLRSELGESFNKLDGAARAHIDDVFEYTIKRSYDPEKNQTYFIPVAGLEDNDRLRIRNETMKVDNSILNQAFDSIMPPIMTLIDEQVAEVRDEGCADKLKGILLVGGLSKSKYLYNRARQEFPSADDLKVWRPDNAWTAVVQGAVLCETSGAIHSRLSGYNYGVPYLDGRRRKVRWLVRKSQVVHSSMATEPYGLRIDNQPWLDDDEYCRIIVTLVRSDEENATDEYNDHVTPHAEIDCRVPTSLRHDSGSELIQTKPEKAWHVPAKLVMYLDGAIISFRCQIKDCEVGVAEVSYFTNQDVSSSAENVTFTTCPPPSNSAVHVWQRANGQMACDLGGMILLPLWAINEASKAACGQRKFSSLARSKFDHIGVRTSRDVPRDRASSEMPGRYGKARKWKPSASSRISISSSREGSEL